MQRQLVLIEGGATPEWLLTQRQRQIGQLGVRAAKIALAQAHPPVAKAG